MCFYRCLFWYLLDVWGLHAHCWNEPQQTHIMSQLFIVSGDALLYGCVLGYFLAMLAQFFAFEFLMHWFWCGVTWYACRNSLLKLNLQLKIRTFIWITCNSLLKRIDDKDLIGTLCTLSITLLPSFSPSLFFYGVLTTFSIHIPPNLSEYFST